MIFPQEHLLMALYCCTKQELLCQKGLKKTLPLKVIKLFQSFLQTGIGEDRNWEALRSWLVHFGKKQDSIIVSFPVVL